MPRGSRGTLLLLVAALSVVASGISLADAASRLLDAPRVSASSTAIGFDAADLAGSTTGSPAAERWRSGIGDTVGVSLRLRFHRSTSVDRLMWRPAPGSPAPTGAYVRFSDGSSLLATAPGGSLTTRFVPRRVTWIDVLVTAVSASADHVALSMLRADSDGAGPDESSNAANAAVARRSTSGSNASTRWDQVELRGDAEIASVSLTLTTGPADREGTLVFSDGSRVAVAGVSSGAPTTVAFTPRSADHVRYVFGTSSTSRVGIEVGARDRSIASYEEAGGMTAKPAIAARCDSHQEDHSDKEEPVLLCPTPGAVVAGEAVVLVGAPAGMLLTASAWRALPGSTTAGLVAEVARATTTPAGVARFVIPTGRLMHGPVNIRIDGPSTASPLYVQLVNRSGIRLAQSAPAFASTMTLQFHDDFSEPVSVSDTGADSRYTTTKPSVGGASEFGDAIFAQASWAGQNIGSIAGLGLRLRVTPTDRVDPRGYDRAHTGALLSSTGLSGSGFSAQYGYFEATMLGAPGIGTWPAFWTQSVASMRGQGYPFGEADAVELYGHDTARACHGVVDWTPDATRPDIDCRTGDGIADWALEWHSYGVRVLPDRTEIYVDRRLVKTLRKMTDPASPFFFMMNLELGGGWPIDLQRTGNVTDLWIRDVRVYT